MMREQHETVVAEEAAPAREKIRHTEDAALLRPLVNAINRIPLDESAAEATYQVVLTVDAPAMSDLRDSLVEALEKAHYPVGDTEVVERSDDIVEIVATLVSTTVAGKDLDAVTSALEKLPGVRHATWDANTND